MPPNDISAGAYMKAFLLQSFGTGVTIGYPSEAQSVNSLTQNFFKSMIRAWRCENWLGRNRSRGRLGRVGVGIGLRKNLFFNSFSTDSFLSTTVIIIPKRS